MMKKFGCFLLTLTWLVGMAAAEKSEWGGRNDRGDMREKMKAELGLTADQQKKLESHRIDQRAEMEKLWLVVKEKREALKTALENPQLDKSAIRRINEQLKDAQGELADQRIDGILFVREILTPDQFKKFMALRPEKGDKGDHRWNPKGYGGRRNESGNEPKHPGHKRHDEEHDAMDDESMDMPKNR